jgi:hypothetical protein
VNDGEIGRRQAFPVGFEKRRPSGVPVTLRGGLDAVFMEDVGDRASSNLMSEIRERATDPRISPRAILECHAQNEIDDRLHDARPPRPTPLAVVPFSCHQFPVPAQQGVRCDQRAQFVQHFATERVRFSGESSTFGIGEPNAASAEAFLEQSVLFLEIVDDVQLMTVDPPSEHHQQQVQRLEQ